MKVFRVVAAILLFTFSTGAFALKERHLIIICPGEGSEAKQIAELLLRHGFDNRSIQSVYIAPKAEAHATAEAIAEIGVFSIDKIKEDGRLIGDDPNNAREVRKSIYGMFEHASTDNQQGHIVFITAQLPAQELIEALTNEKTTMGTAQAFVLPIEPKSLTA